MSEPSLLQVGGAPATKQYKNVPLTTSLFFSGLWTQRSPFGSPDSRYYNRIFGGRTDILIDGSNTEITNYGTIIRRPGTTLFSSATLDSGALSFYSFHPIGKSIAVIADTAAKVYTLTSTTATSIFTKSSGAGQTYFQGIGTTLYMGNGVDQKAYPFGLTTRNWGISLGSINNTGTNTQGPLIAGTGATGAPGNAPWTNPNNVTSAVNYATDMITGPVGTDDLNATNFGFTLGNTTNVQGIQVTLEAFINPSLGTSAVLNVYLLKNGVQAGSGRQIVLSNTSVQTFTFGGSSDLWGASWTYNDINQTTFGAKIQGIITSGGTATFNVRNVRITVNGTTVAGPPVTLVAGTLTASTGFQYMFAYGNSSSGNISNPTQASALIKPVAQGVQITLTASTDSQVTGIRVFRTKDGGSTFFELPTSPYPNTSGNVTDNATDATLQLLNFFPSSAGATQWLANSPPPVGLTKMTYHLNRMWGVVANNVYFSALLGDDITLGTGVECWPPVNVFVFPNAVNRLLAIASGLLVFTEDDIYMISGTSRTGITGPLLTPQLFQQGVGLLSYNALDVEGNQIFLYTSDKQFLTFTASGPMETGFGIGVDLQASFDPTKVYVAALVAGTQDKAVFISDGTSSWYRCNWNQPPEGGPAWSPKATITGGASSIVSVETSPGVHQLLIGQSNGAVLVRNYSVFSDNGAAYSAYATIGSLVLAKPGQLAALNSIVLELQKVGSVPSLFVMLDELSGNNFEQLLVSVDDPPRLSPSQTILSKRWYLSQGNESWFCRHIQVKISWAAEAFKNELLTMTEIGALVSEE